MYKQADFELNLWARGGALQCCFNQVAIDFAIPIYFGSVNADAVFDPSLLASIVGQVKNKAAGDKDAESAILPLGISRDSKQPLPYLALHLELGNESKFQDSRSNIRSIVPEPTVDGRFQKLTSAKAAAKQYYDEMKNNQESKYLIDDAKIKFKNAELAEGSYNRDLISVRGASAQVYRILNKADIVSRFATLLKVTLLPPTSQDTTMKYMHPFQSLVYESDHNAWMSWYKIS